MSLLLAVTLWGSIMGHLPSGLGIASASQAPALQIYVEHDQAREGVAAVPGSPLGTPSPGDSVVSPELRLHIENVIRGELSELKNLLQVFQPAPAKPARSLGEVLAAELGSQGAAEEYRRAVTLFESCVQRDGKKLRYVPPSTKKQGTRIKLVPPTFAGQRIHSPITAADVSTTVLREFAKLLADTGASAGTVEKYIRYIGCSLSIAMEAGDIGKKPKAPKLPKPAKKGRTIKEDDFTAFLAATREDDWKSPEWWRASTLLMGGYGQRIGEASTQQWVGDKVGDIVTGIHWDKVCPRSNVAAAGIESPFGWLVYVPGKQEEHKPDPLALPLTEAGREVFARAQRAGLKPAQFIAPFGDEDGHYKHNRTRFDEHWDAIMDRAGIPAERRWTPHDWRRNVESRATSQFSHLLATSLTGHAVRDVSSQSYVDITGDLVKLLPEFSLMKHFETAC